MGGGYDCDSGRRSSSLSPTVWPVASAGRYGPRKLSLIERIRLPRAAGEDQLAPPVQPVQHGLLLRDRQHVGRQPVPDHVTDRRPGQRMGRERRLVRLHRQDQPVIALAIEVRGPRARPRSGSSAAIRFHAANWFVASLLRIRTSIWCGSSVVRIACQLASRRSAPGRTRSSVHSLGMRVEQHLLGQRPPLLLHQPRIPAVDHLERHPRQRHGIASRRTPRSRRRWPSSPA